MSILGDDDSLLGSTPNGSENNYAASLGRISGKLLSDNLLRNGTDLAFDTDLLYLKVSVSPSIGINRDVPIYTLDVNSEANFNNLIVTTQAAIDNIIINAPDQFTTSVGGIQIRPAGVDPIMFHDRLTTSALIFNDNSIGSIANQNIVFDPNGTGQFRIEADTNITGDLGVSGNITISGNLSKQGSIFLGDDRFDGEGTVPENDTITINTDFAQSIIPGQDLTYNLGIDKADSTPRRWSQAHIPDWTKITTGAWAGSGLRPQAVIVSDQMRLDGVVNKISAIQSNEDIMLNPDTGIVYVESVKFSETQWINPTTLNNPNAYGGTADDEFGRSVSISNTYAIIGAPFEDDAGGLQSGKAYIYNAATGDLLHTLSNPNAFSTSAFDFFGSSVSISNNYAIVGAHFEDDAGSDSGKAYIYNAVSGTLLSTLNNPNPVGNSISDYFGFSVSISDNYAIVGAYLEDAASLVLDAGKAYIYNAATGALLHTLNNPNAYGTASFDYFGYSVAISNSRAIVGAWGEDDAGGTNSGKAYIYNAVTGALLYTLNNPSPVGTSDSFGLVVGISDNYAIVGAPFEDNQSGKAYIYNVTTGVLLHTLNNPNAYGTAADRFGSSVSISDTYAIVGAYLENDEDGGNVGKSYIFNVLTGVLLQILNNPNAYNTSVGDQFGWDVAISGSQIIVSAPSEDDAGGTSSGKAYIFSPSVNQSLITNLLNTPLTFASTGIGYTQFSSTNAFVVPSGTTSEQRPSPELGETRWNIEEGYLECFDGSVWAVSTGGGEEVTGVIMEDLSHVYTLMLG
jgi:hypothetical protein